MWKKIKQFINFISRVSLALFIIGFMFLLYLLLIDKNSLKDAELINTVAIVTALLSLPGIAEQLAQIVNPQKKTFKVRAQCPKCRHSIQMDMKED